MFKTSLNVSMSYVTSWATFSSDETMKRFGCNQRCTTGCVQKTVESSKTTAVPVDAAFSTNKMTNVLSLSRNRSIKSDPMSNY